MGARSELFVRKQSGGMFSVVSQALTTGNIFFVNSVTGTNGAGYGQNPDAPVASIDYAIGLCTANNGDRIYVMPGHVETVGAAAAVALDVAGVEIIGLGSGAARPTVNFTTTDATFAVSAANCTVRNLLFTGGIDAVVSALVVSAADFKLLDCEYRDVTGQCTVFLLTTAAANRMLIDGLRYDGDIAAGTGAAIAIVGGDRITVKNSKFDGNFSVGVIDVRTTATTDLEVHDCWARTRNAACIFLVDTITGSTGMIGPNLNVRLLTNAANITEALTGATFVYFQPINIVNNAGEVAMQTNITASTDA
jgi:hypothetical protein